MGPVTSLRIRQMCASVAVGKFHFPLGPAKWSAQLWDCFQWNVLKKSQPPLSPSPWALIPLFSLATMTVRPQRVAQPRDHRFSHNANSAGAPLPLIPRRTSSTNSTPLISPSRDNSDLSSLSSSPSHGIRSTSHAKRVRGAYNTINDATRPAISRPTIYTPGMSLRTAISAPGTKSVFREFPKDLEGRLVCKKSGQLVKSSLKSSKSATRNTLSVITVPQSSKSEPTTPTQKAVHFDAQLEHVKLFLAEQKPLAVSRDGSPTDDTSGTDSDFPKSIYGEGDDRHSRKKLHMQLSNMPSTINPISDVALESLSLTPDGTSILGRVRVRNIAFAKCVAIRFTFDSWQTTSEVTGRYVESINSEFDKFNFTIRLYDLLTRIEDKTLVMAIRYSVAGQDIWDNNNGKNYMATFTMSNAEVGSTFSDQETSPDMADLRNKLEKMSQSDDRTGPAFLAEHSRRQSTPASPDATCFRTSASFASRYDFAASMGSPRDISPIRRKRISVENNNIQPYTPRNHRRGYFDLIHADGPHPSPATLRRTPPGTPTGGIQKVTNAAFSPPFRFSSFSPTDSSSRSMSPLNGDDPNFNVDKGDESELSTPSLFTHSSSGSSNPSPDKIFMSPLPCDENAQSLSPDTHYRQFINKYVFCVSFFLFFSSCSTFCSFSVDSASSPGKGPSSTTPQSTSSRAPSPFLISKNSSLGFLHVCLLRQHWALQLLLPSRLSFRLRDLQVLTTLN